MTQARTTAISAAIVATVAVGFALHLGRVVFIPIALALVLATLLAPLVGRLRAGSNSGTGRCHSPLFWEPWHWWSALGLRSRARSRIGPARRLRQLRPPGRRCRRSATDSIDSVRSSHHQRMPPAPAIRLAVPPHPTVRTKPGAPSSRPRHLKPRPLHPASPQSLGRAFGTTTQIISALTETVLLLFFLLAGGRTWRDRLTQTASSPAAGEGGRCSRRDAAGCLPVFVCHPADQCWARNTGRNRHGTYRHAGSIGFGERSLW